MNQPTASAVGFAVSDGQPTDARSWVGLDFDGHLSPVKRGFLVTTEPTVYDEFGTSLAHRVREIILSDLRRQQQVPPDIALARAFARANAFVYHELTRGQHASYDRRRFVGATAAVIDDHTMTVAHVPPGQMIMVEDGIVYAVPDLQSWLPTYAVDDASGLGAPDPLGYSEQVRPHLAVTELRPGDVMVLTDSGCGERLAHLMAQQGGHAQDMSGLFGHHPDVVLDVFRDVVVRGDLANASVAVVSLPPLPGSLQVQTLGDIQRRAWDGMRAMGAFAREWIPGLSSRQERNPFSSRPVPEQIPGGVIKPVVDIPRYAISSAQVQEDAASLPPTVSGDLAMRSPGMQSPGRPTLQERMQRLTERGRPRWTDTWRQPSEVKQFGLPGAHGVEIFRGNSHYMGESSWRNNLPRIPLLSAGILWIGLVCIVAIAILGGAFLFDLAGRNERDFGGTFGQIDQQIVSALQISDEDAREAALLAVQQSIDDARRAGAPEADLRQRQYKVSAELDLLDDVIRMSEVTRIGALEPSLRQDPLTMVQTAIGTYIIANGNLYLLQADAQALEEVLIQGQAVDSAPVGRLFAIAADTSGIYVTDGRTIFVRDASGGWIATEMKELPNLGPWQAGPVDAFLNNIYLLEPAYLQIYKFASNPENGVASGEPWIASGGQEGLDAAVDLAIDSSIYVLMGDGVVRTYLQGTFQNAQTPGYLENSKPVAILAGLKTGYLYIAVTDADGTNGRVLAFDPVTEATYQLQLPIGFETGNPDILTPFQELRDIAVDEDSGTMYVLNGDSVWTMRYSLPPLEHMAPDTATPEAG
jgi:hypothetical protein